MPRDNMNLPWQDIKYKGYLHVKEFLSESELLVLRNDWMAKTSGGGRTNQNYPVVDVPQIVAWRFHHRLKSVSDAVYAATGINADTDAGGHMYFSTGKGINFCWHQDPESYFIYQQHFQYLNFYIPLVKPSRLLTNLCLIPFDQLQARIPEDVETLIGSGAKRFYPDGNKTLVCDENNGDEFTLPLNLEELKVVPELESGDLLLLRGDVIHRTQDTSTDRVAVSFRRTNSKAVISKTKFFARSPLKQEIIQKNRKLYESLSACFDELKQEEITADQFISFCVKRAS